MPFPLGRPDCLIRCACGVLRWWRSSDLICRQRFCLVQWAAPSRLNALLQKVRREESLLVRRCDRLSPSDPYVSNDRLFGAGVSPG